MLKYEEGKECLAWNLGVWVWDTTAQIEEILDQQRFK